MNSYHHQIDPLAGLNEAQAAAVSQTEGAVLVLAGAGSGKTRVLAHRIAQVVQKTDVKPWQILAVTFTNKAARELKDRVAAITPGGDEVAAGTFHSIFLRVLRREAKALGYPAEFSIFDADDSARLVKMILKEQNEDRFTPRNVHSYISRLKNDLTKPEDFEPSPHRPLQQVVAHVYGDYQQRLKQLGAMDFDDLLILPLQLFKQHPSILAKWSGRWRYLHVDEYQDTNLTQFELLRTLAHPGQPNVFVVGDDDQSIYGWRGARVENIFRFRETFENAKIFRLEQNYRSTQPILELAHAVVSKSSRREEKKLWTARKGGVKPVVLTLPSDMDEAREVADRIGKATMLGNRAFRDFAVLYRTNAQSRLFEDVFRSRRYPYQVVGNVGFYSRKEVRDAVAYFRLAVNPMDDLSLRRIISEPPRGIGATTLERLAGWSSEREIALLQAMERAEEVPGLNTRAINACRAFADKLREWGSGLPGAKGRLAEWASGLLEESGYLPRLREEKSMEAQGRLDNLEALIDSLAEFDSTGGSLSEYLEQATLATDQDRYDPDSDTVRLMTVHAAKGLEFKAVFVTGLEKGTFPLQGDENRDDDLDEERRLFYVAVTRAEEELVLSHALTRRVWGQMETRMASRFLTEIPEELATFSAPRASLGSPRPRARMEQDQASLFGGGGEAGRAAVRKSGAVRSPDRPPRAPVDKQDVPAVRAGDLVTHNKFGNGIVLVVKKWRGDLKVSVEFDDHGVIDLMQSKARLQPVKDFDS